jgi:alpha-L-fucosidase 2
LRARGGFEVDISWKHGKLIAARIHSQNGGVCRARYGDEVREVKAEAGKTFIWK